MTWIGDYAFEYCRSLTSITIPDSVTNIGNEAFWGCTSLTSVAIGNSVTFIGGDTFYDCTSLTSVTIGNSVSTIEDYAFYGCTNLTSVYFTGNAPILDDGDRPKVFSGADNVTVYYLPGTTGWEETFSFRPTAFWVLPHPTIMDFGPGFGVHSNKFEIVISWATNVNVVVEAASNLTSPDWKPIATNTMVNGLSTFTDPDWADHPSRFYRLREH